MQAKHCYEHKDVELVGGYCKACIGEWNKIIHFIQPDCLVPGIRELRSGGI
jgi:hypothetical protein